MRTLLPTLRAATCANARLPAHAAASMLDMPTTSLVADAAMTLADTSAAAVVEIEEQLLSGLGRDIMIFLGISVAVAPASKVLNVSPVLLYLVLGCVAGPFGLNFFADATIDSELGEFGILFLLFVEGLNLSPDRLKQLGSFFSLGAAQLCISILFIFFAVFVVGPVAVSSAIDLDVLPLSLDPDIGDIFAKPVVAFSVAVAGALSSSAFVLPVLKEKGWESRPDGLAALSILLLQDLAVAPLLVILPLVAEYDKAGGQMTQDPSVLLGLMAQATFGFAGVIAASAFCLKRLFGAVAKAGSSDSFVAATLLVSVGIGYLAEQLGLSATTGAFAAGVILAESGYRAQIEADIKPFEGILLGIFFITAGATLDPMLCLAEWPTLLAGITLFLGIKIGVLGVAGEFALGLNRADSARVALLLAGGGEFAFVVFKLAENLEVLGGDLAKLLTASVIISMSLTPLLGELADWLGAKIEDEGLERSIMCGDEPCDALSMGGGSLMEGEEGAAAAAAAGGRGMSLASSSTAAKNGVAALRSDDDAIVICGYGEVGQNVVITLLAQANCSTASVVAFDRDAERVRTGIEDGHNVVYGDCASSALIRASGVSSPRALVITNDLPERVLESTEKLRGAFPDVPIYARASTQIHADALTAAGASHVLLESLKIAQALGQYLGVADDTTLRAVAEFEGVITPTKGRLAVADTEAVEVEGAFSVPRRRLEGLASETSLPVEQVLALQRLYGSSVQRNSAGLVQLAELRNELMRLNEAPLDDEAIAAWMGYDGSLSKWQEGAASKTYVTFDDFVRFASKGGGTTLALCTEDNDTLCDIDIKAL